jgi:hypothetical protein
VRKHASSASVIQERIRGKGKGKEILYRCEGEVVGPAESDDEMKEEEVVVKDPRKEIGFKKPHAIRSSKTEFIELPGYEVSFLKKVLFYIFPTISLFPICCPPPPLPLYYLLFICSRS